MGWAPSADPVSGWGTPARRPTPVASRAANSGSVPGCHPSPAAPSAGRRVLPTPSLPTNLNAGPRQRTEPPCTSLSPFAKGAASHSKVQGAFIVSVTQQCRELPSERSHGRPTRGGSPTLGGRPALRGVPSPVDTRKVAQGIQQFHAHQDTGAPSPREALRSLGQHFSGGNAVCQVVRPAFHRPPGLQTPRSVIWRGRIRRDKLHIERRGGMAEE